MATTLLLQTKLYQPPQRPFLVPRPHLTAKLNQGIKGKLTLVTAPAGFGKTTLITHWLAQLSTHTPCWLSLDEGDNDPHHFLAYCLAALQTAVVTLGQTITPLLTAPQPPPLTHILTRLINELTHLPRPLCLILDDYHTLTNPEIDQALTFWLDHLPPTLHIILISRTTPRLPLARLRAQRLMNEIHEAELRFTGEETALFLQKHLTTPLTQADVTLLETRTEGWAVGLQLAALSLQNRPAVNQHHFIKTFAGNHRHVAAYLIEEVLTQQPEAIRTFLLHTAILDRFCADLCAALLPHSDQTAVVTLHHLEAANLFLIPLDNAQTWYRYHHLFADFLQHQLQQSQPNHIPTLHRRASRWLAAHHQPEAALRHALAANDLPFAIHVLQEQLPQWWQQGQITTLLHWLDALPQAQLAQHPRLSLYYAWGLFARLQYQAIPPHLQAAAQSTDPDILGTVDTIRGYLTRLQGDTNQAIALFQRALQRLSLQNKETRSLTYTNLGRAHLLQDDLTIALTHFKQAVESAQQSHNGLLTMYMLCDLAATERLQGQLQQAATTYHRAITLVTTSKQPTTTAVGLAQAGLALLHYEWNELDQAAEQAQQAVDLGRLGGLADNLLQGAIALARVQQAKGEMSAALITLAEAESLLQQTQLPHLLATIATEKARLWLKQANQTGNTHHLQPSYQWAQQHSPDKKWPPQATAVFMPSHPRDYTHLTIVRIYIAQQRFDKALNLLQWLQQAAQTAGRHYSLIEINWLRTLIAYHQSTTAVATLLHQTLTLAHPLNITRLFLDEGAVGQTLLQQPPHHPYTPHLLNAFSTSLPSSSTTTTATPMPPLIDPLTPREQEILQLIAQGLSNRDIAQHLTISFGTVRKHVENIRSKLGVHSRLEAVLRAQSLNLLA